MSKIHTPSFTFGLLALAVFFSSCGSHQVVGDRSGAYAGKGATYYLPQTVLIATIPIERKDLSPGEFAPFAEAIFFKPPTSYQKKTSFSIGEDLTIRAGGIQDPAKRYTSLFTASATKSATQVYVWNDQQVLTSGKADIENKAVDYVVATLDSAAKLALAGGTGGSLSAHAAGIHIYPNVKGITRIGNYLKTLDQRKEPQDLEDLTVRIGLTIILADDPANMRTQIRKVDDDGIKEALNAWEDFEEQNYTGLSIVKRLQRTYRDIRAINESIGGVEKTELLVTLKAEMSKEMKKFYGSTKKSVTNLEFRWIPNHRSEQKTSGSVDEETVLFTLNTQTGIRSFRLDPVTTPSASKFRQKGSSSSGKNLIVKFHCDGSIPAGYEGWKVARENAQKCQKTHGWVYGIPAKCTATVKVNGVSKASKAQGIAQQGLVGFLPSTGGGTKVISDIELDPATGGLTKLTQGTVAFDPSSIGKIADAGSYYMTAKREREAAAAAQAATANDPLTQLRRQKEEYELRAAIFEAKQTLGEE